MPFKAYEEFSAGPMVFPIGGKTYEVPEVSYEAGIVLQQVQSGEKPDLTADEQWRLLMGPAYDEMRADNVPAHALSRVIMTCLADYRLGREIAEQVWEVGLDPEAIAPEGATEAASTSTAEANETQTLASTTGTTSRPASSKPKAKAARKRGSGASTKSAPTGD